MLIILGIITYIKGYYVLLKPNLRLWEIIDHRKADFQQALKHSNTLARISLALQHMNELVIFAFCDDIYDHKRFLRTTRGMA